MRGAFVTYNTIGDGSLSSGWHKHNGNEGLVLQNTKGFTWAVQENVGEVSEPPDGYSRSDDQHVDVIRSQIEQLWEQLTRELDTLDILVIYVGSTGSERFIELAKGLPAEKILFVACDCKLDRKNEAIREAGLWEAGGLLCECGGKHTMGEVFGHFMLHGRLPEMRF